VRCSSGIDAPRGLCVRRGAPVRSGAFVAMFAALALAGCALTPPAKSRGPETISAAVKTLTATRPADVEPVVSAQSQQAYDHALAHLKAERFADAERELKALTEREPKLAGPFANLGILYRRTGRAADAVQALDHAIELHPRAAYYNELGMVHRTEGRFNLAERSYAQALALDPNYAYAHLNLGILYDLYLQQPDKALPHYEAYQALVPGDGGMIGKWIADLKRRTTGTAEQAKGGKNG
jgi:tetratricopeptide (TPR) repeat protein